MFQYNLRGEREYTIIDMNRDGVIDFAGNDRVTRTLSEVVNNSLGLPVQRTRTMVWMTPNIDSATGDHNQRCLHRWVNFLADQLWLDQPDGPVFRRQRKSLRDEHRARWLALNQLLSIWPAQIAHSEGFGRHADRPNDLHL